MNLRWLFTKKSEVPRRIPNYEPRRNVIRNSQILFRTEWRKGIFPIHIMYAVGLEKKYWTCHLSLMLDIPNDMYTLSCSELIMTILLFLSIMNFFHFTIWSTNQKRNRMKISFILKEMHDISNDAVVFKRILISELWA